MIEKTRSYGSGRFSGTDLMTFCPGDKNRARPLGSAAVVAVRRQQGSVSSLRQPAPKDTPPPPPSLGWSTADWPRRSPHRLPIGRRGDHMTEYANEPSEGLKSQRASELVTERQEERRERERRQRESFSHRVAWFPLRDGF